MDQVNGTTASPKKKQVLFSIGSYGDGEKRVINKISTNGLFASATTDDAATIRSQAGRTLPKTRPASLNFLDSISSSAKYQTLPARHRYNDGGQHSRVEKPTCPPSSACNSPVIDNGPIAGKPAFPPKLIDRSMSLEPEQLRHSGRVALTIAAYEGEPRTPTRLEFLSSGRVSRASSTSSTPAEDVDGSRMMLQNELAATLKRSNLKKLMEDDVFQENGTPDSSPAKGKSAQESKTVQPMETPENIKTTDKSKSVSIDESKNVEVPQETQTVEQVEEPEIKEEIYAALTELENSTVETSHIDLESVPPPPAVLIKDDAKQSKVELKNGESKKEEPDSPELTNHDPTDVTKESKDEVDVTPNGSVKQLAVELGKIMTFKADCERVPEQNGIQDI